MSVIFCYSSTGNSLYVAKKIAEKINAEILPMSKDTLSVKDDVIGFIFPVFFWGLPKPVLEFIKNLEIENKNAYIFAVATYGGFTIGEAGYLKKIIKQKNLRLSFYAKIKAVENYIPSYRVNNIEKVHFRTNKKLSKVIEKIKDKKKNKKVLNHKTLINTLGYSFYLKKCNTGDKNFLILPACNGCGICQKICFSKNIELKNGKPEFLHNCSHCLACIHACPKTAINYLDKTQKKERYLNPNIKLEELIKLNNK